MKTFGACGSAILPSVWIDGFLDYWSIGSMDFWIAGIRETFHNNPMIHQSTTPLL
jgi:hypothetical protein